MGARVTSKTPKSRRTCLTRGRESTLRKTDGIVSIFLPAWRRAPLKASRTRYGGGEDRRGGDRRQESGRGERGAATAASEDNATAKTAAEPPSDGNSSKPPDPSKFRAIFHIWPDFEVSACINKSIATVKADAAQNSFSARGAGITWAVMDSGIQHDHPHFRKYANVDPASPLHKDFTVDGTGPFDDQERPRHARRGHHRWRMARAAGRAARRSSGRLRCRVI